MNPRIVFLQPVKQVPTWRNQWPAAELTRRGHDVVHLGVRGKLQGWVEPTDTVVVHVTAELATEGRPSDLVGMLRRTCRRVIVQFDDDWTAIGDIQPMDAFAREFIADIVECCRLTSLVIVATPTLAGVYARWANEAIVVRNYPPRWVLELPTGPKTERLGWMGRLGVHTPDLELLKPFAPDLPPMTLVGTGKEGADLLCSWGARDVIATAPTDDIRKLHREMSRCRAAVVPLRDTRFGRGRSWNKPLEFACQDVPVVCSSHPEYEDLASRLSPAVVLADLDHGGSPCPLLDDDSPRRRVLDAGLIMEERGGTEWERALDIA